MHSEQKDLFSQMMAQNGYGPVVLKIKGIVPGKKNNKMLITKDPRGRPLRRPMMITKPEYQKALEEVTESLRFQLLSTFRTPSGETLTGFALRSLIAYSMPEDDAWTHVPVIQIEGRLCSPGEESVVIKIDRLN